MKQLDKKKINSFAKKWRKEFLDDSYDFYNVFDNIAFSDECFDIGFVMDCGESFSKKYPNSNAFDSYQSLQKILESENDLKVLGSALFSKWRYYNHWSYDHPDENEIKWFIVLLDRLYDLTNDSNENN